MNSVQAQLLSVKTTKPQYLRTHSLRSSAATNEFVSDDVSDASSTKSDITIASYETPPSRVSTPDEQQIQQPQQPEFQMTLQARAQPLNENKPLAGQMPSSFDVTGPPTPGVDDTPYVRFAIEQLTRDEDVMGHGRHGSLISDDFPTTRVMPHEGTGFIAAPTPPSPIPIAEDGEIDRRAPMSDLPQVPHPVQITHIPRVSDESTVASTQQKRISRRPLPEEFLLAANDLEGQSWADTGYIPAPLRPLSLGMYTFLCLLMIAGLLFSNVYVLRDHGLYDYDGISTSRYFIAKYLPSLLGIILILWLFVIEAAMYRIIPYICMSTNNTDDRVLQDYQVVNSNYVLPDLSWFRNGQPLLGLVFLIFWLTNFTIPLLSCLYQTQWITNDGPQRWRWTTLQPVGWTLFVLYVLLVIALTYCAFYFRSKNSALRWDPTSLADLVVLFQRSNLCAEFERSEISQDIRSPIPSKLIRLGFWTTSQKPEVFHGVGKENAALKRLSINRSPITEKFADSQESSFDIERQRYSYSSSFTRNIHSPYVRYRWVPWFLRDSAVLAWIIAAILLLIAFLVVSFVNRAVQDGFVPLLDSRTDTSGFSASNFLYNFLPALLGMFLFLAWQPVDTYFRTVQPFANLSNPSGAGAERSLLVSYTSSSPLLVTVRAVSNGDYKLAYISLISVLSFTLPVLAGGVFSARQFTNQGNQVRMVASMPGYIALCVCLCIYALSYLAIWPRRKRALPHKLYTIADYLSFIYASPLLSDGVLKNVRTKADLVSRLVGTPFGLTGDARGERPRAKYAFGIYIGRDGKEHLGIDRLQRPGSGEMLITTGLKR